MPYRTRRQRQCSSMIASPLQELQTSQVRPKRRKRPSLKQLESQDYLGSTQQKKKKVRFTKTKNDPTTIMSSPASEFNAVKPPLPSNTNTKPIEIDENQQSIGSPSMKSVASASHPSEASDDSRERSPQTDSTISGAGMSGQNTQVRKANHLSSSAVSGSESGADGSKTDVSENMSETEEVGSSLPKSCEPRPRSNTSPENVYESGGDCLKTDANINKQVAERNESKGSDDRVIVEGSNFRRQQTSGYCNESESKASKFDKLPAYLSSDYDVNLDQKKPEHSTELKTSPRSKTTPKLNDLSPKKLNFDDSTNSKKKRGARNAVRLPSDAIEFGEDELMMIDRKLEEQHKCFTRFRDYEERSEFPFPQDIIFSLKYDMPYVQKPFKDCRCPKELYGNYAILDVATQWMFCRDAKRFDLHLPACTYFLMSRRGANNSDPAMELSRTVRGWDNFFEFTVIPIIVWHGEHFSIAYVVNAGVILKKKIGRKPIDDVVPCILYSNSLPCQSAHNKLTVSKNIRSFLNRVAGTRMFSIDNMKAYNIKTCVQLDGYSCAYHTILSRDAVLKEIHRRTITESDIKNDFRYRNFSYNVDDTMKVRAGIYKLVSAINSIKNPEPFPYQSSTSDAIDCDELKQIDSPFHRPGVEAKKEGERARKEEIRERKKTKQEQRRREKEMVKKQKEELKGLKPDELIQSMREKKKVNHHINQKRKEDMARMNEWESRIGVDITKEEREKRMAVLKRSPERRLGEPAKRMEQTHDRAFRRACYNAVAASSTFAATCRYRTPHESMMIPRPKAFLVIIDPMSELPYNSRTPTIREQPVRIVVGANKEEFIGNLTDMIANIPNTVFSDNAEDVDELLLGPDRISLDEFISKKKKRDVEEERMEDNLNSLHARDDITQSVRKNNNEAEKVREDDGF